MKYIGARKRGTIAHFVGSRWGDLNKRTVNGSAPRKKGKVFRDYIQKGIELRFTRSEFKAWCESHAELIMGLYTKGETPSLDRIDSRGHYELNNLRIISLKENANAGRETRWNRYKLKKWGSMENGFKHLKVEVQKLILDELVIFAEEHRKEIVERAMVKWKLRQQQDEQQETSDKDESEL